MKYVFATFSLLSPMSSLHFSAQSVSLYHVNLNRPEAACTADPCSPVQFVLQQKLLVLGSVLCAVEPGCPFCFRGVVSRM